MAAAAEEDARKALPAEAAPAPVPAPEPAEPPVAAEAPPSEAAPAEASPAEAAPAEAAPAEAKPAEAEPEVPLPPAPAPAVESEAVRAALDEAVSKATGVQGDRLARLREALQAVGKGIADVRQVRVFTAEQELSGAIRVGDHQYAIDRMPESMKPQYGKGDRDERRGRGPRGPRRGGDTPLSGSFSMDALKDDKRGQRRGPGGPGRGPRGPGGGPKA